ncbi:MAG: asparaginase [Lachnospiraceae bacterium]|nr:asparaginase [Lachnospiraceae bacterium]
MRVSVIFTGGTIGSKLTSEHVISTDNTAAYELLAAYESQPDHLPVQFLTSEPYYILSENIRAQNLITLIREITNVLSTADPDGIIVTHGTDTLQYTAAILGYVFSTASVPIILVSSNYVLQDARANGLSNFSHAISFLSYLSCQWGLPERRRTGVFVSYQNTGQPALIHRATRLLPSLPFTDEVHSCMNQWFAKLTDSRWELNPRYLSTPDTFSVSPKQVSLTDDSGCILRIRPYPGMVYPEIPSGTRAILHESFHSGTIGIHAALTDFVTEASRKKIPIYLSGFNPSENAYETSAQYRALGLAVLPVSSVIAQYCKLWLATGNGLKLDSMMQETWGEDLIT